MHIQISLAILNLILLVTPNLYSSENLITGYYGNQGSLSDFSIFKKYPDNTYWISGCVKTSNSCQAFSAALTCKGQPIKTNPSCDEIEAVLIEVVPTHKINVSCFKEIGARLALKLIGKGQISTSLSKAIRTEKVTGQLCPSPVYGEKEINSLTLKRTTIKERDVKTIVEQCHAIADQQCKGKRMGEAYESCYYSFISTTSSACRLALEKFEKRDLADCQPDIEKFCSYIKTSTGTPWSAPIDRQEIQCLRNKNLFVSDKCLFLLGYEKQENTIQTKDSTPQSIQ